MSGFDTAVFRRGLLTIARSVDCSRFGHLVGREIFTGISARAEKPLQDVVFVGRNDELTHGESETFGIVSSEDITKVARWYNKLNLFALVRRELKVGGKVVDDLCEDSRPVDRVDGAETVGRVEFLVGE